MKILVLGVTGMLGYTLYRYLQQQRQAENIEVFGLMRGGEIPDQLAPIASGNIFTGVDLRNLDKFRRIADHVRPDIIVNCAGIIKHNLSENLSETAIAINSLLPHQLSNFSKSEGIRFIHISTDCVFSGNKGGYKEDDPCDVSDLYGMSKFLGEVVEGGALTLRTSFIGPEIRNRESLLEWFLLQKNVVNGYSKAIFSGLTTLEFAKVMCGHVFPNSDLQGLYHISSHAISKFSLLMLIKDAYDMQTEIVDDESVMIDRSLNSDKFREMTGYIPPSWPSMVKEMKDFG